jgi:stage II sporulation protein P
MRRFKTRRRLPYKLIKIIICIIIILISFILTIKALFKITIKTNDEKKINEMLAISSNNIIGNISFFDLINIDLTKPETLLKLNFSQIKKTELNATSTNNTETTNNEVKEPLIYIYNTHQTEEYKAGNLTNYNITPTVYIASNILKKILANYDINSIVEDENIKDVLNQKGWNYNDLYKVSKIWLERCKTNYPSIKYFVDVHRDSVSSNININDKMYAKMMFVVGMNHENYAANESLMIKINTYLNDHYNGVMKSIYYGKRGVYNQDFDPNTFLIEIGGPENTIEEVYNSTQILGEAISEVIGGENGR